MSDERQLRNFHDRDAEEQNAFLENTWCNRCQQVDLGMSDPVEFTLNGRLFIEGQCRVCGETVTTELVEDDDVDG
ncbi:hypothetical protein [Saccharospirillum impatiens]|uniref:hypothetical protein n=1 Tax=Saccharospirillum impatiens TaxID=169438 RepID=UPI000422CC43|nr:hypothetical protein [Saccharospirillum impatiens]